MLINRCSQSILTDVTFCDIILSNDHFLSTADIDAWSKLLVLMGYTAQVNHCTVVGDVSLLLNTINGVGWVGREIVAVPWQ